MSGLQGPRPGLHEDVALDEGPAHFCLGGSWLGLSSAGGSHAMQGVEVFESVGAAAEEVKPSDEKITEARVAVAEHPSPSSGEQKPS